MMMSPFFLAHTLVAQKVTTSAVATSTLETNTFIVMAICTDWLTDVELIKAVSDKDTGFICRSLDWSIIRHFGCLFWDNVYRVELRASQLCSPRGVRAVVAQCLIAALAHCDHYRAHVILILGLSASNIDSELHSAYMSAITVLASEHNCYNYACCCSRQFGHANRAHFHSNVSSPRTVHIRIQE